MRLLFKQRVFSWFDSYDIYDEQENVLFTVQGKLSWGHRLEISDVRGFLGTVQQEPLSFPMRFSLYIGDNQIGELTKEFTFFIPRYSLDCNGWQIEGDFFGWDYTATDANGNEVMHASKEPFHWSDYYVIDVADPSDMLICLMIVLSIDAANCGD